MITEQEIKRLERVIEVGQLNWFPSSDVRFLLSIIQQLREELEELTEFKEEVKDEYEWMTRLLNAGNKREKRLEDQIESLQKELDKVKEEMK